MGRNYHNAKKKLHTQSCQQHLQLENSFGKEKKNTSKHDSHIEQTLKQVIELTNFHGETRRQLQSNEVTDTNKVRRMGSLGQKTEKKTIAKRCHYTQYRHRYAVRSWSASRNELREKCLGW